MIYFHQKKAKKINKKLVTLHSKSHLLFFMQLYIKPSVELFYFFFKLLIKFNSLRRGLPNYFFSFFLFNGKMKVLISMLIEWYLF